MRAGQKHTLVVERRVIRADGTVREGDHNQVVAFHSEDGDVERALSGALIERTGITPLAEQIGDVRLSDEYLELMERQRWEQERRR